MSQFKLDKTYDPAKYEAKLYQRWEKSGAFKPNPKTTKDPFTIILPPPNANGHIHVGTAMFVIEDIMTRYRRMQGHPTLWLPGMDHAGIETQVVYERRLAAKGQSRFDLGRDEFVRQVTQFTRDHMGIMTSELQSMGFSLDWSRLQFTLDQPIVDTVYQTFKDLHDQGYIYRGNRLVNWCPYCRSAFADIEIKYRQQIDPLYYIKYGPFVLATVRPETKFGDTAIAVNPKDERYAKYVGQTVEAEDLLGSIQLKVIADDYVDPEFGTGVVKVTPAHDPNDWEMGLRHNLKVKQVVGTDGLLTALAGKYAGMPVAEARQQVAHDLEERGLIDHIDMNYTHSIGYHDRCGTLIEPLTTPQWWLKVDQLKQPVIQAIEQSDVTFVPDRFTKVALDWMHNLRDWNISRQNWYGIRIPVYYNATGNPKLPEYIVATDETEAKKVYGENGYEPETDIFDTWFSSGQWPYATLMATGDFNKGHYPTSVMETGRDLIFLWVTRMIMFGLFKTGEVPFRTVYFHGMITDAHGKKMSKSKGNVINPLDMTSKFGTDALRLALTIGITPGNDGAVSEAKIEGYRNFCNKLWNVARFILGQLPDNYSPATPQLHSPGDHWLMAKLNAAIRDTTKAIEDYRFSEAGQLVYSLLWDDFADWYLEASKVTPNHDLLVHGLETILRLLHPIAPFVTEAIWSHLPWHDTQLITTAWPVVDKTRTKPHPQEVTSFNQVIEIVSNTRSLIAAIKPQYPQLHLAGSQFEAKTELISKLARITTDRIQVHSAQVQVKVGENDDSQPDQSTHFISIGLHGYLAIYEEELLAYKHRLTAELYDMQAYLRSLTAKLSNKRYLENAPAAIVQETRDRHAETTALIGKLEQDLARL